MAGADEIVLAGSRPQSSNPIDSLHNRTAFVLIIDSLIVTFALYSFFGTLALIPGAFFLAVWSGYKSKAGLGVLVCSDYYWRFDCHFCNSVVLQLNLYIVR